MRNLDFVAVVYNNYADTVNFCNSIESNISIANQLKINCYIVDNSDNNEFILKIKKLADVYDFVKIIRPPKNIGYFGAFNFFFESEYFNSNNDLVLCNNDLVFSNDFCEKYIDSSYPSDAMVICPNVITKDGFHQNPHLKNKMGILNKLKLDLYFSNFYIASFLAKIKKYFSLNKGDNISDSGYIHMGIGACYILRVGFLSKGNKLCYPHFLYGEEAYFSNQIHAMGGKLYFDNRLFVRHEESATLSKIPSRITYEYARNGYKSYRKYL